MKTNLLDRLREQPTKLAQKPNNKFHIGNHLVVLFPKTHHSQEHWE